MKWYEPGLSFITGGAYDTANGLYNAYNTGDYSSVFLPEWMGSADGITDAFGITNEAEKDAAYQNANDVMNEVLAQNDATYGAVLDQIVNGMNNTSNLLGGEAAATNYTDALANYDPTKYSVDTSALGNYQYGKNVSDFMDPAAEYNINQSVKAATEAMAGQGGLSGGAAARQLQAVASEAASNEYSKAYERMAADKEFDYGTKKDTVSAEQNNAANLLSADKTLLDKLQGQSEAYIGNLNDASDDYINALMAYMDNNSTLKQSIAQMQIDRASQGTGVGNLLSENGGAIMSIIGSFL